MEIPRRQWEVLRFALDEWSRSRHRITHVLVMDHASLTDTATALLCTASSDQGVRVWDARSGSLVAACHMPDAACRIDAICSCGGSYFLVAVALRDFVRSAVQSTFVTAVRLWDWQQNRMLAASSFPETAISVQHSCDARLGTPAFHRLLSGVPRKICALVCTAPIAGGVFQWAGGSSSIRIYEESVRHPSK